MKKSKLLSTLLVLTVSVSIALTGCGSANTATTTGETSAQGVTAATTQATTQPPELKEIEVTVTGVQEFDITKDKVAKAIYDATKVKIVPVTISAADDMEQIKLWAATGSLPDIFGTYTVEDGSRFMQWIDQGIIRSVPQNLIDKYPKEKKIFEDSAVLNAVKEIKGAYYGIPRPESLKGYYKANFKGVFYRLDWAANVGYATPPATTAQLADMLVKFTNNDPDKNGKNDTFGLLNPGNPNLNTDMWEMWGLDLESWYQEDGRWIPGWISKKNIDVLNWMRELYKKKVLDPEFAQATWQISLQKLASGKVGMIVRNATNYWINRTIVKEFGGANTQYADPTKIVGIIPPVAKDENTPPQWFRYLSTGATEINAKVSDEKLDRILGLYEYLMSDEALNMLRYGILGESYEIKDGVPTKFKDAEGNFVDLTKLFPSKSAMSLPQWDADFEIEGNDYPLIKGVSQQFRDQYGAIAEKPNLVPRFMSTPSKDNLTIGIDTAKDKFVQIIVGNDNVDKMFNDFVDDCLNNKGLSQVIKEVNDAMPK